ncbi:hypothetical protein JQT77_18340 [Sulfitobacter mediterraneus]|uniref:hypothetical protein n=1 Tax=Sulfitobacter mediterraneus TaxID=83219 RepID=UPI001932B53F|nr:hypothetical protein [Sulfitobacter mediterraneus]MBM1312200.1 hypothetical protein [Sulfitobacter mediterraneus]MBM1324441.1 hypothetical protein [Sulfitobacter mediterraneus]MBM1328299.1 hypothetical protein [Sulfitobacter mediterraneus]MBM1399672.1 hypothetical protein [Sulfitobacter mediterraneus]MBM1403582.1 hypothetical protein [Sulfitobacter mediterraneus]
MTIRIHDPRLSELGNAGPLQSSESNEFSFGEKPNLHKRAYANFDVFRATNL